MVTAVLTRIYSPLIAQGLYRMRKSLVRHKKAWQADDSLTLYSVQQGRVHCIERRICTNVHTY